MIKFHQKYFIDSTPVDQVNPHKIKQKNQQNKNIEGKEIKLLRFQINLETKVACRYKTPQYRTQNWEIFDKYEKNFDMKTGKLIINPIQTYKNYNDKTSYIPETFLKNGNVGGKLRPQDIKQHTLTRTITNEQYLLWRKWYPFRHEVT